MSSILFFAVPGSIGGMEMHAEYFIQHFSSHERFPIAGIITKNNENYQRYNPAFLFFNSGHWIEELEELRQLFPKSVFIYRTGGNEILKAPLIHQQIPDHASRLSYWVTTLNSTLDVLITNSAYTENRLRTAGITSPFLRCIGGVNTAALQSPTVIDQDPPTIFCAARFVPYKNHALLLSVIRLLVLRGHKLRVRLAGDGPLLESAKQQVAQDGLSQVVQFLGPLDNRKVCQEISQAQFYMQLSTDHLTEVPGGSYIHAEGMGRSILEALTAGTFVIAGRSGALPEIVTEDRGLLVDLNSAEQIADTVEPFLKQLPKKAPFFDGYCWNKIFKRYEHVFASH